MNSKETAVACAVACLEKKALDLAIIDVNEVLGIADYFVIASGTSDRQVVGICDSVEDELAKLGLNPYHVEGKAQGRWVLVDYVDVVVHVFHQSLREFYNLEGLWYDAPRLALAKRGDKFTLRKTGTGARKPGSHGKNKA